MPDRIMTASSASVADASKDRNFPDVLGHPRPLWMLFMTEFWERFSFYGMRWALTLYIVAQFFDGSASGEGYANRTYGAYLALVYASALFGGYAADRLIGYQRSILIGAVVMAAGLFTIMRWRSSNKTLSRPATVRALGRFGWNSTGASGSTSRPGSSQREPARSTRPLRTASCAARLDRPKRSATSLSRRIGMRTGGTPKRVRRGAERLDWWRAGRVRNDVLL